MQAEQPLRFESVRTEPLSENKIVVTLEVEWTERPHPKTDRAMLVVETDDGRHAVPANVRGRRMWGTRARSWSGSFPLPSWLHPSLEGNTSLVMGELTIPIPEGFFAEENGHSPRVPVAREEVPAMTDTPPSIDAPAQGADDPTVAALQAELERRTAGEAAARGELARLQAELAGRGEDRQRLEATHAELRRELAELRRAVHEQSAAEADRDELTAEITQLRGELATSNVSRDAAMSEAAGLRAELERLGAELVQARQQAPAPSEELQEAEALLAEARSLRAQMDEHASRPPAA